MLFFSEVMIWFGCLKKGNVKALSVGMGLRCGEDALVCRFIRK